MKFVTKKSYSGCDKIGVNINLGVLYDLGSFNRVQIIPFKCDLFRFV